MSFIEPSLKVWVISRLNLKSFVLPMPNQFELFRCLIRCFLSFARGRLPFFIISSFDLPPLLGILFVVGLDMTIQAFRIPIGHLKEDLVPVVLLKTHQTFSSNCPVVLDDFLVEVEGVEHRLLDIVVVVRNTNCRLRSS